MSYQWQRSQRVKLEEEKGRGDSKMDNVWERKEEDKEKKKSKDTEIERNTKVCPKLQKREEENIQ